MKAKRSPQLGLFAPIAAPEPAAFAEDRRLVAALPASLRFGTSSWTFAGWRDVVFPSDVTLASLREDGLSLYAKDPLFRTVGIDRSFYAPLTREELADYATQVPADFLAVAKVFSELTSRRLHGEVNQRFLDVDFFEREVLRPTAEAFGDHVGALVFEFSPMPRADVPAPRVFAAWLDVFFGRVSRALPLAVELRNRELLTPEYLEVLAKHRVAHVVSLWERMPSVGEQLAMPGIFTAPFTIARLSLHPGERYEEAKTAFAPFDKIVKPREQVREDVTSLALRAIDENRTAFVIANNKVEGSSPLTIRALAERIERRLRERDAGG